MNIELLGTAAKSSSDQTGAAAAAIGSAASRAARTWAGANGAAADSPLDGPTQAAYDEAVRALRGGRVHEAEKAFLGLLRQRPDIAGVHANLGLVYRSLGRLDAAAAELEEAAYISPRCAGYHNQLGLTWRMLGRLDEARRAYETALEVDPSHAGALINLAILHASHLGEPGRAAELYSRAAQLLPEQAGMIRKWVGELKNRGGSIEEAGSQATAA